MPGPASAASGPIPGWNGEMFLLCIAQHRRNKNLDLLLRSFGRLVTSGALTRTARLVIVGMQGPETPALQALVQQLELAARVDFLEGLSEAELHWCYRHCAVVVAPSSIEGFGLPVAEARMAGCRIVCSDIPAFCELASAPVRFVSLQGDAESGLGRAVEEVLRQPRPAPDGLPELSLDVIAAAYVELYRATLAQQPEAVLSSRSMNRFKEGKLL